MDAAAPEHIVTDKYANSVRQLAKSLIAWTFLALLMFLARLVWYWELSERIPAGVQVSDWTAVLRQGLRQDICVAGYFLFPAVVCGMLAVFFLKANTAATLLRNIGASLCVLCTPLITFSSIGYYEAYSDCFGVMMFEFFEGNAEFVVGEARREYQLIPRLALSAIGACFGIFAYVIVTRRFDGQWLFQRIYTRSLPSRSAVAVLSLLLVFIGLRGGIGRRPVQKLDSSVTAHQMLNHGAVNSFLALRYAVQEYRDSVLHQRQNYDTNRLVSSVNKYGSVINHEVDETYLSNTDNPLQLGFQMPMLCRTAKGSPNKAPSHVFFLFMESYDSWPMLDQFADLKIAEEGKKLASEGIFIPAFLPAGNSSVISFLACLQGIQETNRSDQRRFPTSIVENFKRLGYTVRGINGFPADWAKTRVIAEQQGFDEVYCVEDILPGGETSNHWLHDRTLYEFANQLDFDKPSLTIIRTSSNHGPWEVDLAKENCIIDNLPENVDGADVLSERALYYGHAKYADKMMGQFVKKMSQRFPDALFVITGDHYGRNFLTHSPTIYERSSVPFILYGPQVLRGLESPRLAAGCHLDICPTLVELCAPEGFEYCSLGKNLLQPLDTSFGIGLNFVVFPDCIVSLENPIVVEPLPWTTASDVPAQQARVAQAKELHELFHGLGFTLASSKRTAIETANQTGATQVGARQKAEINR